MVATISSEIYETPFYGILNQQGEFWSPLAYDSEQKARDALEAFIAFAPEQFRGMRGTHSIVPVRIQLTELVPA